MKSKPPTRIEIIEFLNNQIGLYKRAVGVVFTKSEADRCIACLRAAIAIVKKSKGVK